MRERSVGSAGVVVGGAIMLIGATLGAFAVLQVPGDPSPITIATSAAAVAAEGEGTALVDLAGQVGARSLWSRGITGQGVDIAIVDTGVSEVEGLAGKVVHGPDFSTGAGSASAGSGTDGAGHGTHLAGLMAARSEGADPSRPAESDLLGIAPDARVVSVKVAGRDGAVEPAQVVDAIDWVVEHRTADGMDIKVLTLAYAEPSVLPYEHDPVAQALERAWAAGIVVVTAGGNGGAGAPTPAAALDPYVIAVSAAGATPTGWTVPDWTSKGSVRTPDVVAPGVSLQSLRAVGSAADAGHPEGRVDGDARVFKGTGTSQSAAVVSGAAALLLQERPDLTPDQVKFALTESASDLGESPTAQGSGLIDVEKASEVDVSAAPVQAWRPSDGSGALAGSEVLPQSIRQSWPSDLLSSGAWSSGAWSSWRVVERRVVERRLVERGVVERRVVERGVVERARGRAAPGRAARGPAAPGRAGRGPVAPGRAGRGRAAPGRAGPGRAAPGRDALSE